MSEPTYGEASSATYISVNPGADSQGLGHPHPSDPARPHLAAGVIGAQTTAYTAGNLGLSMGQPPPTESFPWLLVAGIAAGVVLVVILVTR